MIDSFPDQPLTSDDVKVIVQQERVNHVYGMLTGDITGESHGFDMNIGLNVDGGLDHDFFFDIVIDTGNTVSVVAYPRPELPSAEEAGPVDDPIEVVNQEDYDWELIYQESKAEASIDDVVAALKEYRDFAGQEATWVEGLAQSGVLNFINDR